MDDDKLVLLVIAFHRGEDARDYVEVVRSLIPTADLVTVRPAGRARNPQPTSLLVLRLPSAQVADAVSAALPMEAVQSIGRTSPARLQLDDTVWQTQTNDRVNPTTGNCADGSRWCYDSTAKLFARGVTGRGQVLAIYDDGLENDDCHFRYAPYPSDTTQPLGPSWLAPLVLPLDHPALRPDNKVVAYYVAWDPEATMPTCPPQPHEFPEPPHFAPPKRHGSLMATCSVGDDYRTLAAWAGVELDDPLDDEDPALPQTYGVRVEHHEAYDGTAPGAQLIVQDFPNCLVDMKMADVLEQAYFTPLGARVHNNSWGTDMGTPYPVVASEADTPSWRLRDMLPTFSAGNIEFATVFGRIATLNDEAEIRNGLTVGASTGSPMFVDNGILNYSAHGPAAGGRLKPDLAAPGDVLWVPFPVDTTPEHGLGDGRNECAPARLDAGTSHSTAILSGLALDVRQYFVDGYYPGGSPGSSAGFVPTNALVKAVLINSTRNLPGSYTADSALQGEDAPRPTHGQGWGFPVLDDTLFFAGDPTNMATVFPPVLYGVERSFLLVLNDVPNGLLAAASINDGRGSIVDRLTGAIRTGEVHEFEICVQDPAQEDLHVTLVWADAPSPTGFGALRNDLDLEVIGPGTTPWIWRPNVGADSSGPDRLWESSFSIPGYAWCPSSPACSVTCPVGERERHHEQAGPPFCDFQTRERRNNVENVFISRTDAAGAFAPGTYTIRVIGYSVPGGTTVDATAYPNFVDGDGLPDHDLIDDTDQGYALVVSGNVASPRGHAHFGRSAYSCGDDDVTVHVRDCNGISGTLVTVTTAAGDCDRFPLLGGAPFLATPAFDVAMLDADAMVVPVACGGALPDGDGTVVSEDDALMTVTYEDVLEGRVSQATTRVTCRDVRLLSVVTLAGCDPPAGGTPLRREEVARPRITIENPTAHDIKGITATLHSLDAHVLVLWGETPLGDLDPGPATADFVLPPILVGAAQPCPLMLRFRVELSAESGFRDRIWFDLPLDDCAVVPMPGEVPARNDPGVVKAMRMWKVGTTDVEFRWDRPVEAGPAVLLYNIWRGMLGDLLNRGFTHELPPDAHLSPAATCNIPETLGAELPDIVNTSVLNAELVPGGPASGNRYYLITAEMDCANPPGGYEGPFGYANRDRDGIQQSWEARPGGVVREPGCLQ